MIEIKSGNLEMEACTLIPESAVQQVEDSVCICIHKNEYLLYVYVVVMDNLVGFVMFCFIECVTVCLCYDLNTFDYRFLYELIVRD